VAQIVEAQPAGLALGDELDRRGPTQDALTMPLPSLVGPHREVALVLVAGDGAERGRA
jgi:hypothetical protein